MQKAHKRPFPKKSKHRAGSKLDLVHSDVQGPFDKSAVDGDCWAINFVDDHTRFTVVYTMKSKDEALKYFKHYCAQYGTPRCLRSDNGGEYTSHSFETFCLDKGIRQDLTVPHTPEQNGVAERSWRTLDEMARCMRHHANLTEEFWSYAITTAAYIRNRCLTNAHDLNTTPYEMFYGEKPSFEAMKVFGCTAYMHLNEQERYGKWDDKAEKGVLVGYSTRSKGWRIYVPRTDSVYVRRNVTFNENDFGEAYEDATNLDEGVLIPEEEQCLVQQHDDESDDEGNRTDPDTEREETPEREDVPEPIPAAQVPQPRYPSRNRNQAPLPCEMTPRDVANLTYTRDSYGDINSASAYMVSVNQKHRTPKSHSEVLLSDDTEKWLASEAREMKSHHDNGTWDYELVPLPNGKKAVGSKWVYKVKENSDGTVDVFKSRVVAQGFSQVEGVDFNETFAPTLRYTTLRTLLALASIMGYALGHLDVSTAYLYGELDEEIYMEQPKGYEKYGPNGEKLYCRLRKSLYGLKQAGRNWNILLDEFMKSFGFRRSEVDPCLYIFEQGSEYLAVAIYVDDLLTVTNSEKLRKRFTDAMSKRFKITDKGDLEWFLGMHVERHDGLITLDQQKYADDTAAKFNQSEAKSTATPANEGERLSKADCQQNAADSAEMKGIPFMNLVGSLIYFMVSTRPDIAFAVSSVSRFMTNYGRKHWKAAQRILQYVKTSKSFGLVYGRQKTSKFVDNVLYGFADSDWASDPDDRRSTSGYIFMLNGAAVGWCSRKQVSAAQALSSCEAEYIAACEATKEVVFLRALLKDLGFEQLGSTRIYVDNTGAINMAKNPVISKKSKHIDLRFHYLRHMVASEAVELVHVNTEDNVADMLTKSLGKTKLRKFRDLAMGVA